jgi:hypothetical protein
MTLRIFTALLLGLCSLTLCQNSLGQSNDEHTRTLRFPEASADQIDKGLRTLTDFGNSETRIRLLPGKVVQIESPTKEGLDQTEELLLQIMYLKEVPSERSQQQLLDGLLGNQDDLAASLLGEGSEPLLGILGGSGEFDSNTLLGGLVAQPYSDEPFLENYSVKNTERVNRVLGSFLNDRDGIRMDVDRGSNSILIWGNLDDHKFVASMLAKIEESETSMEIHPTYYLSVSLVCPKDQLIGDAFRPIKDSESELIKHLKDSGIVEIRDPHIACGAATIISPVQGGRSVNRNGSAWQTSFEVLSSKLANGYSIGIQGSASGNQNGPRTSITAKVLRKDQQEFGNATVKASLNLDFDKVQMLGTCKINNVDCVVFAEIFPTQPGRSTDDQGASVQSNRGSEQQLLLKGNLQDIEKFQNELNGLLEPIDEDDPNVKELPVKGNPTETAQAIIEMYNGQLAELYGPVKIKPSSQGNTILVVGKEASVDLIRQILNQYETYHHADGMAELSDEELAKQRAALIQAMQRAMKQRERGGGGRGGSRGGGRGR